MSACDALGVEVEATHELVVQIDQVALEEKRAAGEEDELLADAARVIEARLGAATHGGAKILSEGKLSFQLSGFEDREQIERYIGVGGKLEFLAVDETISPYDLDVTNAPPGSKVLPMADGTGFIAVKRIGGIRGSHLVGAMAGNDPIMNEPMVNIQFDEEGAKKFAQFSQRLLGQRFAIVVDDVVISAPYFAEPVLGGLAQISGNLTNESARHLAIVLQSGELRAPVKILTFRPLD